ncbi:MAG: hypothetical protein A2189_03685 [Paenibacillus sp. RIFOXYA1_FULL_44_5]|nr:MAG: hypothetical protein A2189_03685 [Paenibacillus sp. RIFOXYA1_FULL_44_5]
MPFQLPVSIRTYSISSPGIAIYYPSLYGFAHPHVQHHINQTIQSAVHSMRLEQNHYQTGTSIEMTGHYEIKTNERGILSLLLSNYAYSYPMAHGFTIARSLTFDVNTGKVYALHDLFKPDSDYVKRLSEIVAAQIKERAIPTLNEFSGISHDQEYYLADKSLVLYYQPYQLSPGYVGFPMFPIPIYSVESIAQGPLTVLSADVA